MKPTKADVAIALIIKPSLTASTSTAVPTARDDFELRLGGTNAFSLAGVAMLLVVRLGQ